MMIGDNLGTDIKGEFDKVYLSPMEFDVAGAVRSVLYVVCPIATG